MVGDSTLVLAIPAAAPALEVCTTASEEGPDPAVGPHVTILYPFLPPLRIGRAVERKLAAVVGRCPPFHLTFDGVGTFPDSPDRPGVTWLQPGRSDGLEALARAITAAFPDRQPYGGAFDTVVHHLTIAMRANLPADVVAAVHAVLPISMEVTAVVLMVRRYGGPWRVRSRLPLGVGGTADPA